MPNIEVPSVVNIGHPDYRLSRIDGTRAENLDHLIANAVGDPILEREFGGTLAAYTDHIEAIQARLARMYEKAPVKRIGYLIVKQQTEEPVGMTYIGLRPVATVLSVDGSITSFPGINFSSWLLKEHRKRGIRSGIGDTINEIARQLSQSHDPDHATWRGGTVYTGIRDTNQASERVTSKRGYAPVGVLLHDTAYRAWLRPDDWQHIGGPLYGNIPA